MASRRSTGKKTALSKKISHLMSEGKSQKQAVATALSMKKAGRLTKDGGYRKKKTTRRK
tara:strand:- start:928 stop:1104 length:177 start_codon:yes stop_codon:yes gene_type:complete